MKIGAIYNLFHKLFYHLGKTKNIDNVNKSIIYLEKKIRL